jgi:hypothetical protein
MPAASSSASFRPVVSVSRGYVGHVRERVNLSRAFPSALESSNLQPPSLVRTNTLMSHTHPTAASSSSFNFQIIINNALNKYKKRTKSDLLSHPLAVQLQTCDSPNAILVVLQEQLQGLDQSRSTDERWTKWLDPTVNVLYAFSSILGAGVGLVCIKTCTCLRRALSYLYRSYSHLRVSFLPESASSCQ